MKNHWLAYFLVIGVGCAGSVGSIFGIQSLTLFSFGTMLSPLPLVFNSFRGLDYWAQQGAMALTFEDGKRVIVPTDHKMMDSIEGPHARTIAYLVPSILAPVVSKHRAFFALKKGLCNFGPLDNRILKKTKIQKIELLIYNSHGEFEWYDQDTCD